jgi:hypothetical protein
MNRRNFIVCVSVLTVLPFLGKTSARLQPQLQVGRKRLGPNAREVNFFDVNRQDLDKPLRLQSKGNAIWIDSVLWENVDATHGKVMIRKNLSPGMTIAFPAIDRAVKVTFVVTCLPLVSTITTVELLG